MDFLYLSSLCSVKEYERMFNKYGTTSSHASQKFNRLFVRGLIENGCSVETLTERIVNCDGEIDVTRPDEMEDGVLFRYLPKYPNSKLNRIRTIWNAFKYICKWHRDNPQGIIICDIILGELSLAVWLAKKFKRIKTTAIVTDVPSLRAGETRKGLKALPIKIKNSLISKYDSYVFLTEQMNKKLNPRNKPYVVIEGLIDADVVKQPNHISEKDVESVIMMAGLLEDIYGVEILLQAFMHVNCEKAKLKFFGKGASVPKIIEASKIDSRISYCGELTNSEIIKQEKKATLLINPRPPIGEWTAYSFPSKNMEYIASGTPLVAFDLPCIPNEYKPYFYHLKEYTINNLKDSLETLLAMDKYEVHNFGIQAQSWIVKNKNPKVQIKKYIELI